MRSNDIYFKILSMNNEWPVCPTFFLEIVIHFRETEFILIIYTDWTCAWTIFWVFLDFRTIFYYLSKQHKFRKWCIIDTCWWASILFLVWHLLEKLKVPFWTWEVNYDLYEDIKFFCCCLWYDIEFSFRVIFRVIKLLRDKV